MNRVEITWLQLQDILKVAEIIHPSAEVKAVTLTKPKTLLIDTENKELEGK